MSETRATTPDFPPGRYGRRRSGRRRRALPIIILALFLIAGAVFTVVSYQRFGQVDYEPKIVGWDEPTDTTMVVQFKVRVPAGEAATCVVRARDYGGYEVGRQSVEVRSAGETGQVDAEATVTTSARGSVGDVMGCRRS